LKKKARRFERQEEGRSPREPPKRRKKKSKEGTSDTSQEMAEGQGKKEIPCKREGPPLKQPRAKNQMPAPSRAGRRRPGKKKKNRRAGRREIYAEKKKKTRHLSETRYRARAGAVNHPRSNRGPDKN